jgi:hypothetical protein
MMTEHITKILEEGSLSSLSASDRLSIEQHITGCADCLRAYQAAVIAAELLQARASVELEPTPFFKTRVMAALRERKAESSFSFGTLWQTARAMVASMVMVVAILLAVNFYAGGFGSQTTGVELSANENIYSAEWVLLENGDASTSVTDTEALTTLYESPNDYEQDN